MNKLKTDAQLLQADVTSSAFLMDCIEGMKQYPDKYFDLAVVDPPYGNIDAIGLSDNKKNGKQATKRKGYRLFENIAPNDEYYLELERVSKNQIVSTTLQLKQH